MIEPFTEELVGQLVEGPGPAGQGEAPVPEIDVVELEVADRFGAGGVNGGQGEGEAGLGSIGCLDRAGDVVVIEGLGQAGRVLADADPGGGVLEDRAAFLAVAKQGADDAQGVVTFVAGQAVDGGEDVVAGDFA
jgi:hypothetical protein